MTHTIKAITTATSNWRSAMKPHFEPGSLVGMTMGARKRLVDRLYYGLADEPFWQFRSRFRIGERLRPCLGCSWCGTPPDENATRHTQCDGSGVLPARKSK